MARPTPTDPMLQRMNAALTVIRRQVRGGPEVVLQFAVFARAVADAVSSVPKHEPESAAVYLEGTLPHLEYCGVDPDWARSVLRTAGLRLGSYNAQRCVSEEKGGLTHESI